MYLQRTFDTNRVNDIVRHSSIREWVCDDNSKDFAITDCSNQLWIGVYDDDQMQGVLLLVPQNSVTVELHTCLLPSLHGQKAMQVGKLLLAMAFATYQKVVTSIPSDNRHAVIVATKIGFKKEGINRQSFLKNSQLLDQIVMGITHEEYLCQSQQPQP